MFTSTPAPRSFALASRSARSRAARSPARRSSAPADREAGAKVLAPGKKIGVCGGCTYDTYLQGTLEISEDESGEPVAIESVVSDPKITTYDTDSTAIQDLALGDGQRLDAVISALPTLQAAIDSGLPIKIVGEPLYYEPLSVAIDKSSELDPTSLVERISEIVGEMHADGTLSALSEKWYGADLTVRTS